LLQLIIVQAIIFGMVFFWLKKLLSGDTETAVNRLDNSYKEQLNKKQELLEELIKVQADIDDKKKQAANIIFDLKEAAEKEITERKDDMLKRAKNEAERIVTDAQRMRDKIRTDIKKEEENNMYVKCAELLDMVFKDVIREKFEASLIDEFLLDFAKVDSAHISSKLDFVEAVYSKQLDEKTKSRIKENIYAKIPSKPPIKEIVDGKIIGGIMLKFGSLVLDGSVAAKIKEKLQDKVV
jgi:F0F1-type ATP synthase membrane subunit b/b'